MELKEPRKKSYSRRQSKSFLSLFEQRSAPPAYFDGFSVLVKDEDLIQQLHTKGCFGKANLSRSYPKTRPNDVEIIRKRVYDARKRFPNSGSKKVVVVPNSDSEDDYFTNLKANYCIANSCFKEKLALSLEEAFFLNTAIKCLNIHHQNKILDGNSAWNLFVTTDRYFVQNYAAYHYFRSRNWIVKPGAKFGGDYLLYKQGPAFFHASYLVIIDILDESTLHRRKDMNRRSMEVANLIGLNRLCETVGKELMICQIMWPKDIHNLKFSELNRLSIREVIMKRWMLSENRESHK
ncbi:hypothetical protein FQR65_LT12046 [Abscondita terminalis]|nr:hypothetical protein FQR65_LT12046 [Abscondita terminalis]